MKESARSYTYTSMYLYIDPSVDVAQCIHSSLELELPAEAGTDRFNLIPRIAQI